MTVIFLFASLLYMNWRLTLVKLRILDMLLTLHRRMRLDSLILHRWMAMDRLRYLAPIWNTRPRRLAMQRGTLS